MMWLIRAEGETVNSRKKAAGSRFPSACFFFLFALRAAQRISICRCSDIDRQRHPTARPDMEDLKNIVATTLESKGVLAKIRVRQHNNNEHSGRRPVSASALPAPPSSRMMFLQQVTPIAVTDSL